MASPKEIGAPDRPPGAAEAAVRLTRLADYAPPTFLIDTVDLRVELAAEQTRVASKMRLRRTEGNKDSLLVLDGYQLQLESITMNGHPLKAREDYSIDADTLAILNCPERFTLELVTHCSPSANTSNRGLYLIAGTIITQCEPEGFRRITYFLDRPDVLARYSVTLVGDPARYPVMLSNGNSVAEGVEPDGRRWIRWVDPFPKPSYIFAIVAGELGALTDTFATRSGRQVSLAIYAERSLVPLCRNAMAGLKRAFAWDEKAFDLECDLDRYNVVALTGYGGAMENKGLNVFDTGGIVAEPEITTDDDALLIERIIAHEYFHNWTGNRVTCRDWFQLSLKEGLTRYRDQRFTEDLAGYAYFRIETVKALMRNQFPEDDGPAAHPIKPTIYSTVENFYTNTIYEKGAEVVRMMATLCGPQRFKRAFDLYISRHDGSAVTTEEFMKAVEDGAEIDLAQFRRWYSVAGRPRIEARGKYDTESRTYTLTLTQSCPTPNGQPVEQPFHIPVRTGLMARDGTPLTFRLPNHADSIDEAVLELRDKAATFTLEDVEQAPIPSLLRGFSAPVTLSTDFSADELSVLAAHDRDPVVRWTSLQSMFIAHIREQAASHEAGMPMRQSPEIMHAVGGILSSPGDGMLKSQLLTVPDEPVLSEGLARIPLDAHMAARKFVQASVADHFEGTLLSILDEPPQRDGAFPDLKAIGARKLKAIVLELLMAADAAKTAKHCLETMRAASNMTDMFNALSVLVHYRSSEREAALSWFYERWKAYPTVIDKWFGVQALSRMEGAVNDIIALESHPAFDPNNVARVLAYYGSFCRQNRVSFHDASGKGYEFLADRLIANDRKGRAGGHWLMAQINQWRRYDPQRQALMRKALQRVMETPGISNGLRDLVGRALGQT